MESFAKGMLAVAVLACPLAAAGTADAPLRFHLDDSGGIVVPVEVAGTGPHRFLLDTGSSRSAVSPALAGRLGAPAVARSLLVTPAGEVMRPVTRLERVRVGTAPPASVDALVLPEDHPDAIAGIIGQDLLRRQAYTIDYERRELTWHTSGATRAGVRIPLEWLEGRAAVRLPPRQGTPATLTLVADSGAAGFVLFERPGRTLPPVTALDAVVLRTLAGRRVARRVLLDDLQVGEVRLRRQPAVVVQRPADDGLGDGLLPLHLFARVTIDGPAGYLTVGGRR